MVTTRAERYPDVSAWLPATLLEEWARQPRQPPVWGRWIAGSLMHCDISGFTAMSEDLGRRGKEGAELMAGVLNRFFTRMLGAASALGGVQVKFGGDAMLLLFQGPSHALRAAACGLGMQALMPEFRRLTVGEKAYPLRMRAGIHSGRFFAASVGRPDSLLHYMLVGDDVSEAARIEPRAGAGQVAVSDATAAELGGGAKLARAGDNLWRVRSVVPPEPVAAPGANGALPRVVRRYVLPPLLERGAVPLGEHRRVTVLFINLLGMASLLERDSGRALRELDSYVGILLGCLGRHGGYLLGSDVAEDGEKLIAIFGAPVSNERQEEASVRCVAELAAGLKDSGLELRQRVGVNSGFAFAGEIGSPQRREYTVIADCVNLSARLMSAARPGDTLVSAHTAERAGPAFRFQKLRPIRVKGKSAPIAVRRLQGEASAGADDTAGGRIFGREAELRALQRAATAAVRRGGWTCVSGEPGIGKSRLVQELAQGLAGRGWRELRGQCQAQTRNTPFGAWAAPVAALLGLKAPDQLDLPAITSAANALGATAESLSPALADVLGVRVEASETDPRRRRELVTDAVIALLRAAGGRGRVLLVMEDLHWADPASLLLLAQVLGASIRGVACCLTSRQPELPAELREAPPAALSPRLAEIPEDAARQMVREASAGLAAADVEAIVQRARGNPLFLQEVVRSGATGDEIPLTVNDVIMARLDALPPPDRDALRYASVIGPSFTLTELAALQESRSPRLLRPAVQRLVAGGLARSEREGAAFGFAHALVRDVAYESLPFAFRRGLHRRAATHIETEYAGRLEMACETLLHHAERADDTRRIPRYAAMAGDRAASLFANEQAIEYYRQALATAEGRSRSPHRERSLALERIGDVQATTGQYREAAATLEEALAEWQNARGRSTSPLLPWAVHAPSREAALCRKLAVACERAADYEAGSRWLERAVAVAPARPVRVRAAVYAAKSVSLLRRAQYREAIRWGRLALLLARRSRDARQTAYAHNMLANSFVEEGQLRTAIRHLRQAVRLYAELRDYAGEASANNNIGSCYQLLGVLDAALYYYRIALQADRRVGDTEDEAIVHNNIGEVLLLQGLYDEAIPSLERALGRRDDLSGLAELNLSRCYLGSGDLPSARRHLRRAVRLIKRVGAAAILMEARLHEAELLLAEGIVPRATRTARAALRQAARHDARLLQARGERVLAACLAAGGKPAEARAHLAASLSLARRIGAEHERALSTLALAKLQHGAGHERGARRTGARAARLLRRMGAERHLAQAEQLMREAPA